MKPAISHEQRRIRLVRIPTSVSYAAVINSKNEEIEITDEMVKKACELIEKDLVFPFAGNLSH